MEVLGAEPKWFESEHRAKYYAWKLAYMNADELYWYMFERWRNDPAFYRDYCKPTIDKRFGVHLELA